MRKLLSSLLLGCMLAVFSSSAAAQEKTVVAIHVSETTQALETIAATGSTPQGDGTTGFQWWTPWWHYFVMEEALKESLTSDGTPYVVVTDANIAAGQLLTSSGTPAYPIVISLSSEAVQNTEITPLLNYVNAGGTLFIGGSSFTRNPDGTTRGDFALASAMGLHMKVGNLQNWTMDATFTKVVNNSLITQIPSGTLNWHMPLTSDDISWGTTGDHDPEMYHYIWQVTASGATVIANGDSSLPYLTTTTYGKGTFIYDAAMEPIIGNGGYAPASYSYAIFRNAIQAAFQNAGLPIVKVSPWPYQYNAAFVVRHDFEDYQNMISIIQSSAQSENAVGALGDYYFCTGTLRVEMANSPTVIAGLRNAVSLYGATIGSHNGGLQNPNDTNENPNGDPLIVSDYDYWHWGPDEALDDTPPGYASGSAYAQSSFSSSFSDISGWLSGLNTNLHTYVAPYFNGTREGSFQIMQQLGVITSGEQKVGPFPHWVVSTQTQGKRYPFVALPTSDWYLGTEIAQSMDNGYQPSDIDALVDYYYGLGGLIDLYMHSSSADEDPYEYIHYSASKPLIWPTNAVGVYNWWTKRSGVQVATSYTTVSNRLVVTASVTGATDPNTAIELVIPNWAVAAGGIQVKLNGAFASPSSFRVYNQGVKILVGTTISTVQISYPLTAGPTANGNTYIVNNGTTLTVAAPGILANDTNPLGGSLTAVLVTPTSYGSLTLNSDGSFSYTPQTGFVGVDSFNYLATTSGGVQSGLATVSITVYAPGVLFQDNFSGGSGSDPAWSTQQGTWSVTNGVFNGSSSQSNTYSITYTNGTWTDYSVQAGIQFPTGGYGGGIGGRVNASTGARYGVWVLPESSLGSATIELVKFHTWTSWSETPMARVTIPNVGTSLHTLLVTFQGANIQASLDGVQYINMNDNSYDSLAPYLSGGVSLDMWTAGASYTMSISNLTVQATPLVANNDSYLVAEGGTVSVAAPGVLANDTGGGGAPITVTLKTPVAHGTLGLQASGAFTYTPISTFVGTDSFTYQISAGGNTSAAATVTINVVLPAVTSVTVNPVLVVGGASSQGTVVLSPTPGLNTVVSLSTSAPTLINIPSSVTVLAGQSSAVFTVGTSGPAAISQPTITASFSGTSQSTLLTVLPTGSATLLGDSFSGSGADASWTTVSGTWSVANGVMNGSGSQSSYSTAYLTSGNWTDYAIQTTLQFPAGGFGGGIDGRVSTSTGTRYGIWIYPESSSGAASIKLIKFHGWTTWGGQPMAQATLPNVGTSAHTVVAIFQGTTIQVSVDGVQYVNVTDNGFDSLSAYTTGSIGLDMWTQNGTYTMSAGPVYVLAPPLTAQGDAYSMTQGSTLSVAAPGLLSNDTGGGGVGLSASLVSQAAHGTATVQTSGAFTYVPVVSFVGTDSFTYHFTSGSLTSNAATVTITVNALGVASVAVNPALLTSGASSQGTVTLTGPAASAGTTVTLSSNSAAAHVPATVIVASGQTSANFTITTTAQTALTGVTITATLGTSSQYTSLTLMQTGSTLLFSDNFTGTAGPDPSWTTIAGTWTRASGVFTGSGPTNSYSVAYAGSTWTDYVVQAGLQFPTGGFGGGIDGRVNTATGARYGIWIYPESTPGGSATIQVIKFTGWTAWSGTPMAVATLPAMGSSTHTVLLSFKGSTIQASVDGVQYVNVTDSSFGSVPAYTTGAMGADMWTSSSPYNLNLTNLFVSSQ